MGYGKWEVIRQEIQKCREFQFDWFFRTRSASEIQRRFDALYRLMSKENGKASVKRKDDYDENEGAKKPRRTVNKRKQTKSK